MHCDEAAALGLLRYIQEEILAKCRNVENAKSAIACALEVIEDVKSNLEVILASKIAKSFTR